MDGSQHVSWIRGLVHERIANELRVEFVCRGADFYRLELEDKVVEMPAWAWGLGDSMRQHSWFDPSTEALHPALDGPLPAPGADSLPTPLFEQTAKGYFIHYDILGLAFWMLSRAEEVGRTDLDKHERFPATSSHAYRNDYLERPVVDEWFTLLRQIVQRVWTRLPIRESRFEMRVSHDVDEPSRYGFRSFSQLARAMSGDIVKRRDLVTAVTRPIIALRSRHELQATDPCNTFDWIMNISERENLVSAFYFVSGRTDRSHDPVYDIEHRAIRKLISTITRRGHEIGLHPSYGTFRSPTVLASEARKLKAVCAQEGVIQSSWGGRTHYLRWETPTTLYSLVGAGLSYDSSLGYADRPGFRCGTCFEYTAIDPVLRRPLELRIRPLIVMECSVISNEYLGLGTGESAFARIAGLKDACRRVGGVFNLLWHNSQLTNDARRDLYKAVIAF